MIVDRMIKLKTNVMEFVYLMIELKTKCYQMSSYAL